MVNPKDKPIAGLFRSKVHQVKHSRRETSSPRASPSRSTRSKSFSIRKDREVPEGTSGRFWGQARGVEEELWGFFGGFLKLLLGFSRVFLGLSRFFSRISKVFVRFAKVYPRFWVFLRLWMDFLRCFYAFFLMGFLKCFQGIFSTMLLCGFLESSFFLCFLNGFLWIFLGFLRGC